MSRFDNRSRSDKPLPIQRRGKVCVIGMDVVALYPSIKKDIAAEAVTKAIKNANIEWANIDIHKLRRYVAITTPQKVIKKHRCNKKNSKQEEGETAKEHVLPLVTNGRGCSSPAIKSGAKRRKKSG